MSICLPSRWLLAAALLIAAQPSAFADQPKMRPVPQTAPPPVPSQTGPGRYYDVPLLIEEEQISEHGTIPHIVVPPIAPAPRVLICPGLPTCDDDDDRMAAQEMTLRCLLFTINPFAAFLPFEWQTEVPTDAATLPAPVYLQHAPQYIPPSPAFPLEAQFLEQVGLPDEVEHLDFMPTEIELLDAMPAEESETHYELLEPWNDSTKLWRLPLFPLTEIEVGVREEQTGTILFGVGIELSRTGTVVVNAEPQTVPPAPGEVLPQPRPLSDIGPRTQTLESSQKVFGTVPIPTASDLANYRRHLGSGCAVEFSSEVIVNHTRLLQLKEVPCRIQIADTTIADHVVLGPPTEVLVQGMKVGSTPMKMWFGDRNDLANQTVVDFNINVLPDPDVKRRLEAVYKALQDEINKAFPEAHVCLNWADGKMVVNGEAKDTSEASRILQILARNGNGGSCTNVISQLKVPAETQVQLSVVIAELHGKAARTLNLGRDAQNRNAWVTEVADAGRLETLRAGLTGLREQGRAKVVAEPCMVTLSGQQASFLSGGEQAIPHIDANGQASVQYEEFGTHLSCRPIVLADGTIRLEVEPEISEMSPAANANGDGVIVSGRTSQRVHTVAEVAAGHALVICGPKMGRKSRLLVIVTPSIVEMPGVSKVPSTYGDVLRKCQDAWYDLLGEFLGSRPSDAQRRMMVMMNQSENLRQVEREMERFWMVDQPSHLSPERVAPWVVAERESATVHELLVKCQRELSRHHYAGAQDLAQQALERNREQTLADPLVVAGLLQRVKEVATIPLGTVDPCTLKPEGAPSTSCGEAKAIGSKERMVQALMEAFNGAYKEARYREAEALAARAVELDPENGALVAFRKIAQSQLDMIRRRQELLAPMPQPASVPQYATIRPLLPPVDSTVVDALQKILIDSEKGGPAGGGEESEPKDNDRPPQR